MHTIKCMIIDDEPYARRLISEYADRVPFLEVVAVCQGAWEIPAHLQQEPVDLLLLDIEMPEWDGLSFLNTWKSAPKAILITAHRDYAVEAFDLEVVDYLLKPVSFERFMKAIHRFQLLCMPPAGKPSAEVLQEAVFLKEKRQMIRVDLSAIMYVEVMGDYVKVFKADQSVLISRLTLKELLEKLPDTLFLQVHRSFVIAKNKVTAFTADKVRVGDQWIPISRPFREVARSVWEG